LSRTLNINAKPRDDWASRLVREERWRRVRHALATAYLIGLGIWMLYEFVFQYQGAAHLGIMLSQLPR
jgi:hypothetical protein